MAATLPPSEPKSARNPALTAPPGACGPGPHQHAARRLNLEGPAYQNHVKWPGVNSTRTANLLIAPDVPMLCRDAYTPPSSFSLR
eukprot:345263-Rhodomonas_salina.3